MYNLFFYCIQPHPIYYTTRLIELIVGLRAGLFFSPSQRDQPGAALRNILFSGAEATGDAGDQHCDGALLTGTARLYRVNRGLCVSSSFVIRAGVSLLLGHYKISR